jgi:hypothetical protein
MFLEERDKLGHKDNIVKSDETRYKRHGNVGRILRSGWFWRATERLTAQQRHYLN